MTLLTDHDIATRYAELRARIDAAAHAAGRDPADVHLVAVTKTHPAATLRAAHAAGMRLFGENRVQEAIPKMADSGVAWKPLDAPSSGDYPTDASAAEMHLIGHLQSNKARLAAANFHCIHSVDSVKLARELQRFASALQRTPRILLQINISRESTKNGMETDETSEALREILATCPNLRVDGLMTIAPLVDNPEAVRPVFRQLRELRDELRAQCAPGSAFTGAHLSMGMTNDFPIAIAEGATLIRVGTALFGAR